MAPVSFKLTRLNDWGNNHVNQDFTDERQALCYLWGFFTASKHVVDAELWIDGTLVGPPAKPYADGDKIIARIADILYPMDEPKDHQWNGGDVCEQLAALLYEYDPTAMDRQKEDPDCVHGFNDGGPCPRCDHCDLTQCETTELVWNGDTGCHVDCEQAA